MPEAKVKCPNCGFENRKGENDCVKCGIVFAKFKARKEGREKLFLSSKIPYEADSFLIKLIYPIAIAKEYVEVDHISIFQFNRTGGAFQERVARVWRSNIQFKEFKSFFLKMREGFGRFYAKPKKTGVDATPSIAFNPDV